MSAIDSTIINLDQLTKCEDGTFTAEASELGWRPGFMPAYFTLMGEGSTMIATRMRWDVHGATYTVLVNGLTAIIFND